MMGRVCITTKPASLHHTQGHAHSYTPTRMLSSVGWSNFNKRNKNVSKEILLQAWMWPASPTLQLHRPEARICTLSHRLFAFASPAPSHSSSCSICTHTHTCTCYLHSPHLPPFHRPPPGKLHIAQTGNRPPDGTSGAIRRGSQGRWELSCQEPSRVFWC